MQGPHTLALARNACLKNNMHFELAHIELTKQIKQKSEYTSCNPEHTSAGIMMQLPIDRTQGEFKERLLKEDILLTR